MDGKKGWTVVAAAFGATAVVFGITYSFGVLFDAMAAEFGAGRGATAAVFSLMIAVLFLLGVVTGPAADRYGPRPLLLLGAAVMSAGLFLTATADSLWVGYFSFGLGVGLGAACTYVPMVVAVAGWFDRQRTLALAAAVAGIGAGTLAGAPITAWLLDEYGFRSTCLIFAVSTAIAVPLCSLAAHRPARSADAVPVSLGRIARDPAFIRLYASAVGLMFAISIPFVFLTPFAKDHGIPAFQAAWLVGIMGGASIPGRLALAALGARWGAFGLYRGCFLVVPLSLMIWLLSGGRFSWLVGFAVVFGIAYGGWIALSPAVVARLYGTTSLGRVLGLLYTAGAVGVLAGPPTAGAMVDLTDGYPVAILLAVAVALIAWDVLGGVEETSTAVRARLGATDGLGAIGASNGRVDHPRRYPDNRRSAA
jgi:MFS family permease